MRKTRILIDARCVGGEGQGMLTYIKGLYNALHEKYPDRYELFFAGYDEEAMLETFPFIDSSQFIALPEVNKIKLFSWVFPKIEEDYKIDYAHFQYVTPFRKKSKHIVTTHDLLFLDFSDEFSFWYKWKRKYLFKRSLLNSDIRLTVSNYSKNRIAEWFSISQSSIEITPNAVHPKFFVPFDKKKVQEEMKEKFGLDNYILYVSRIEKRKNQALILESYENLNLAKKGTQLVLVGNDTLGETRIPAEIKRLQSKYPNQVHWLSHLEESDLMKVYQGARLFVYPSLAEGFGIPPIEAAALGIETLCSDQTAMEDFSFFGENQFNPYDIPQFQKQLLQLLDKTEQYQINSSYRSYVQSHYAWSKAATVLHEQMN